MATIANIFSALIASENGHKCKDFREKLHNVLLCTDVETGICKSVLFKSKNKEHISIIKSIANELVEELNPICSNIDVFYFGQDLDKKSKPKSG